MVDLPTLPWTCKSHRPGIFVRTRSDTPPALWVGPLINKQLRTVSNSGEVQRSQTMGISDAWTLPLRVVTVEITYKTKGRLRIDSLDAHHSFTKTIKHSVVHTRATIDINQIIIQPLTTNFLNHELTTRSLEYFLPPNRKTRAIKQPYTNPNWASAPQQQSKSFEARQKQLQHTPKTSYLCIGTGDNIIFYSLQWLAHLCCHSDHCG